VRIHHLNCVSACPLGGALMDGRTRGLRARLTNHCLLIEASQSLVLVDTGYGLRDIAAPRSRLNPVFLALLQPELREELTAVRQIEALGFSANDVRHIVLSHLDFDHAGGLDDFPHAKVHLLESEVVTANAQATLLDRMRYRPQQWSSRSSWLTYDAESTAEWRGFSATSLQGLPPEILLVPLLGHTLGHAGVAVADGGRWLFYAADAYFFHGEMQQSPYCTPGLSLYQRLMEKDRGLRLANQRRLRELAQSSPDIRVFCAHDAFELEALASQASARPIPAARLAPGALPDAEASLGPA
jgi:glyoxylase-like metal-dependent hydrolase (beta-lactamase superfamily II)